MGLPPFQGGGGVCIARGMNQGKIDISVFLFEREKEKEGETGRTKV
jgi:hypothetical protein